MNKFVTLITAVALSYANTATAANSALSCNLGLLKDLGWKLQKTTDTPGVTYSNTCETRKSPVFIYNPSIESSAELLARSESALYSSTSKCIVSQQYRHSIKVSVINLVNNKDFTFISPGNDPRDPFLPPDRSWLPAKKRGYDLPLKSISHGIDALYKEPFIAECAAATQIAQLAILKEHYGVFTDAMIQPSEVGVGIWRAYVKAPSIAAKTPLLLSSTNRKRALATLAELGGGAFYGQMGYLKPYKGDTFVDSIDNRGQNFVIAEISEEAVASLRERRHPLKELNKISRSMWKKYRKLMSSGANKEELSNQMQKELTATDPFFSDVMVYVHPLAVRNFAYHIARQFKWNPRTPYVFEMYEDFQSGYFFERYIDYRQKQCQQQAYCRRADKDLYYLTDETGLPGNTTFQYDYQCREQLEIRSQ